ncbi:MAG: metallopeptidase TldD-related protein [Candidatus Thorarchaeota archaeon]
MGFRNLVRDEAQLDEVADLLAKQIKDTHEDVVSRYTRVVFDTVTFLGETSSISCYSKSNVNKEIMQKGVYSQTAVADLLPHNIDEIGVARDIKEVRFNFEPKNIPLPTEENFYVEKIPYGIEMFDEEFREFTKDNKDTMVSRSLEVEQRIIVNSRGGKVVQTVPFFLIGFRCGYQPIPTSRDISLVCNSERDIKNMVNSIKFLPDPTPDRRIKKSKTFSEAFQELSKISRKLKFGNLQKAGLKLKGLYDVIVITGVPFHEIFGHQFEEPIRMLEFGESATFRYGQNVNEKIIFKDDPSQTVNGLKVQGFTYVDPYGRKREPRIHIENGKVKEFLGSEYVDSEKFKDYLGLEKSEFVGNASQYIDGAFPQPRMSCTFLDGTKESIDWEGKIVVVPNEGSTDTRTKNYEVKSSECYVIKDGEPKRVNPLKVSGGINQAFENLHVLDDVTYQIGMCEKLNPVYNSIYNPEPLIAQNPVSQLARSQLWENQQVYSRPISEPHLQILIH